MPESNQIEMPESYPISQRNKAKRAHHRASYQHQDVYDILDASYLCHVGYVIDNQPYVTPTIHWRVGNKVYWHGSSASRMLKTATNGMDATLTVTLFDGLVLARSPFHHSANYRCAMLFGKAHALETAEEKDAALTHMMEHLYPGRLAEIRGNTAQELKATMVAVMDIEQASAKVRSGPPVDDEEDISKINAWTGVIPRHESWGFAQLDETHQQAPELPNYLKRYQEAG